MKLLINTTNSEAIVLNNCNGVQKPFIILDCNIVNSKPDIKLYPNTDKDKGFVAEIVDNDTTYQDLVNRSSIKIKLI